MTRIAPPEDLSGRQKAAVLCLVLGSEAAAKVTQRLSADEVEALSFEIARLDRVGHEAVEAIVGEWLAEFMAAESLAEGGMDAAREILEKALGPRKAQQVLDRVQSQLADTAGLHRLRNADPQQLGTMLRGEHPQTTTLILAHLDAPQTAAVLKELDPAVGSEVVYRMARMERVAPDLLQLIERSIADETDLAVSQGMTTSGGPAAVASVLNLVPGTLEKQLLEGVAERDPALCVEIKNLMFVFEDIGTLDARSLQRLLRDVNLKALALSLKAASAELKTKVTGSMSQRAVAALNEEMEMLGPVRMRDVEAAQSSIVAQVRELEEAGELVVNGADDDVVI
ncbi:MAG TPA: flagellar motor switch protein FliG [Gemmatimonadaceae bacterium]|nr:flagellar motor switch protein FliG [Gemmatimonadaceae bacterium]